ncbi:glycosyltransferase family 2 protein [Polychaeton citri CBS 116435]|uniref:Glycosyltransferase family 2 protein n=1 Tax=Polychaeton citri CBS 116435 TaxID=1314669 RepID=A0A9P4QEE8_9PEZI|nr:glycosyltransferase family 2 protein [Polychaeton citri CBS 116435]
MNTLLFARTGLRILPKSSSQVEKQTRETTVASSTNGRSALIIKIVSFNTVINAIGFFISHYLTKGLNRKVVLRSISEMRHLQQLDDRIRFVVLTEQDREFDPEELGVEVAFIPNSYEAPLARYKARSLEYFRKLQSLRADDWILHLDEETGVDEHCVRACIGFIERTSYEWGQGIKVYNTMNYWKNPILTFVEVSRFRDDLTCFNFQHGTLHQTIWGCHGSFLLASGKIENLVTWDTSSLAEDYWFGLKASQLGYGSGWIPSIAREQSNWLLSDYFYQRRRWFWGIWSVGSFGRFRAITWLLSSLEVPFFILTAFGLVTVPTWLVTPIQLYSTSTSFSLLFAMLLQDLDAGLPIWRMALHLFLSPFLISIVSCVQTIVICLAIMRPPEGFHIVEKQ